MAKSENNKKRKSVAEDQEGQAKRHKDDAWAVYNDSIMSCSEPRRRVLTEFAAESSYPCAVAKCLLRGWGVGRRQDEDGALKIFLEEAGKGDAHAQNELGWCYLNGNGVVMDKAKAAEWLTKGAEQGLADAQYRLGGCYSKGNGVVMDKAKAVEWYTKAAEQGHADAQFNLGCCYSKGNGVVMDKAKAVEWLTKLGC